MAKIALIEPFFGGSHRNWAVSLKKFSKHEIQIISLPARHWKWRMRSAAITLAAQLNLDFDLLICSDMIDLALFKSLLPVELINKPLVLYFHENQLTYPWTERKKTWDRNYAWINYCSCLVADHVVFNSSFNRSSFLEALPGFLKQFPDNNNLHLVDEIKDKSSILPVGINYNELEKHKSKEENQTPILLWNHRWEFDKNPKLFFETLFKFKSDGLKFDLIIMGEQFANQPPIFEKAQKILSSEILVWGHVKSRQEYIENLWKADILPVTSNHDFFGLSVLEAIYCNNTPLLPNKLAYPEHISNRKYFYSSKSEFESMLKILIESKSASTHDLEKQIIKYDWSKVILQYDDLFDNYC